MRTVIVSGGFDPIHKGHIRLFKGASEYGRVIAVLNSDEWLSKKKGKPFMNWSDRKEVLDSIIHVNEVVPVDDRDGSVCEAIRRLHSIWKRDIIFANGGDRLEENIPEVQVCRELGIELLFNVGGGKIESSSRLIKEAVQR